jgi:hydroxypyruvate isomerase
MPGYVLSHPDQALRIIAEVNAPNIGFQFDLYHCAMIGLDLDQAVTRYLAAARHIQIAGAPGRNEPDTGNVSYPPLLARINTEGYRGWIGCEYRPRGLTREGLGWLAPYLT